MRLGESNELISETSDWPGSIGDSAHNTARQVLTLKFLGSDYSAHLIALKRFRTEKGYIRHWLAPDDWMETDTTSDMLLPLYKAYQEVLPELAVEMGFRLKANWYRSGNGDPITPGLFAEIKNSQFLRVLFLLIQILIFKIPFRVKDKPSDRSFLSYILFTPIWKLFERSSGSSAHYLNFIFVCLYAPKWVRRLVSKEKLKAKVADYYKPEPNAFVVENYNVLIERYF